MTQPLVRHKCVPAIVQNREGRICLSVHSKVPLSHFRLGMQLVIHGVFSEVSFVLYWKIPVLDYTLSHLGIDEKSVKLTG